MIRLFFFSVLFLGLGFEQASAQISAPIVRVDSPYMNPHWRDSVNAYQGRLEAYHQEFYSYDWGMLFSFFPYLGENYVDNPTKGIVYAGARVAAVAVGTIGTIRLISAKSQPVLNIGMIAVGVIGYALLKISEMTDVQHMVSQKDEALVEKFGIATPDIVPGSIRYPTKSWPDWITQPPPPRHPERARDAVDKPLPSLDDMQASRIKFEFTF